MAQQTGIMNSTLFKVYIDGTALGFSNNVSVSVTMSPREITNKDSGGYQEFLEGVVGGTAQASAFFAEDVTEGADEIWTAFIARTTVALVVGLNTSGNTIISATAYITNLDTESPAQEDNVSYSVGFQMTAAITRAAVA